MSRLTEDVMSMHDWYVSQGAVLNLEGQQTGQLGSGSMVMVWDEGRDPRLCGADGETCRAYKVKGHGMCAGHLRALGVDWKAVDAANGVSDAAE